MASGLNFYPQVSQVMPWMASFPFPTEANKATKRTPRIPPKSGNNFSPGSVIRLEVPATGYMNPNHTFLEMDVTMISAVLNSGPAASPPNANTLTTRFQNGIGSIFQRIRVMYGSTPLEDIPEYNELLRYLSDHTSTNTNGLMDQTSIADGVGGYTVSSDGAGANFGLVNVRQKYIQGNCSSFAGIADPGPNPTADFTNGASLGQVPGDSSNPGMFTTNGQPVCTRRYVISLMLGLLIQNKLIPVKYMASAFAIELTLANPQNCMIVSSTGLVPAHPTALVSPPSYGVTNVNLLPELLEYDNEFDNAFQQGLATNGVPILYASWNKFSYSSGLGSNLTFHIQERSRSIKGIVCLQKRQVPGYFWDTGASFFDTSVDGAGTLQSFQYRAGGVYMPAAPVQTSAPGSNKSNGAAEAYIENQKMLAIVGDYRLQTNASNLTWGLQSGIHGAQTGVLGEFDYKYTTTTLSLDNSPNLVEVNSGNNAFCGDLPSQQFGMAMSFETTNGLEISGLNSQEQNDISITAIYSAPQVTGFSSTASAFNIFTFFDSLLVLKAFNVSFEFNFRKWIWFNKVCGDC